MRGSRRRIAALGRGFWITIGALAAAVVAVAVLGGFAPAHRDPVSLTVLGPGETHVSEQVSTTALSAWLTDDPDLFLDEGEQALFLEIELTSNWTRPMGAAEVIEDVLDVSAVSDAPDRVSRADDGSAVVALQPGLATPILLRWDVTVGAVDAGSDLRITLSDGAVRQLQVLADDWVWDGHVPAAELRLPIEDRTGMAG